MSRTECRIYVGAPRGASAIKSRLACEYAGPISASVATSLWIASTQSRAWSTDRSPVGARTALSAVQPDSQGVPSSLAGTAGSLPQSWESGAGWAGTAARQRQIPDPNSSHAISTAVTGLLRTGFSLVHFARLSRAAAGPKGGTNRFPSFRRLGKSPVKRGGIWRNRAAGSHLQMSTRRAGTRGSPGRHG